jgi:hypothetical protein
MIYLTGMPFQTPIEEKEVGILSAKVGCHLPNYSWGSLHGRGR